MNPRRWGSDPLGHQVAVTKKLDPDLRCQGELGAHLVLSFVSRPIRRIRHSQHAVPEWVHQQ